MLPAGIRATGMIKDIFPGLDLYGTGPAQHTITAGWALDDQDRDLSDLSVRRVKVVHYVLECKDIFMLMFTPNALYILGQSGLIVLKGSQLQFQVVQARDRIDSHFML